MSLILLLVALAQDETADEIIERLSADSIGARQRAMDDLIERGRKTIPVLHEVVAKSSGEPGALARRVIGEIGRREAAALLAKAGHGETRGLRAARDDEFARVVPKTAVYILPTREGEDGRGSAERVVVVNDLSDDKGAPKIVGKPEDIPALITAPGRDDAAVRAVARAALFVLRATRPKAHSDELVARALPGHDPDNWWEAGQYKIEAADGWKVTGISMQFGHEWMTVTLLFNRDGRLAAIAAASTGRS